MPAFSASAPGKVILFGEHAVVYGQPAIAVPVDGVVAKAIVSPAIGAPAGQIWISAPQVGLDAGLNQLPEGDPLAAAVRAALAALNIADPPAFKLKISSTIPVAGGLGSGAAVSVAILRAVTGFLGHPLQDEQISALAFEVEKLHHGTPSGIDNTVIAYNKPVYFVKGQALQTLKVAKPFSMLIADSGIPAPTKETVGAVRTGWQADPQAYEAIFKEIGQIAETARNDLEEGDHGALGSLMNANHGLLQKLDVSSARLDELAEAARNAGALGAKLSGGGRGGNVIALSPKGSEAMIESALLYAGAKQVIHTTVRATA